MADMTPAARHQYLVEQSARRYTNTYAMLMKRMSPDHLTPGINRPSDVVMQQHFESTTEAYWQALAQSDPEEAQSQIDQWKQVQ